MVLSLWNVRGSYSSNPVNLQEIYAGEPNFFTLKIHHGGMFTKYPGRRYVDGKVDYVDFVDYDVFSVHELNAMMEEIGYVNGETLYYHFLIPGIEVDYGLLPLGNDGDVAKLGKYVIENKLIKLYIEHEQTRVHTYFMSPSKLSIEELDEVVKSPNVDTTKKRQSTEVSCRKKMVLDDPMLNIGIHPQAVVPFVSNDRDSSVVEEVIHNEEGLGSEKVLHNEEGLGSEEVLHNEEGLGSEESMATEDDESDKDSDKDSDGVFDDDTLVDEVEVNMSEFRVFVEGDDPLVDGGERDSLKGLEEQCRQEAFEVLDAEDIESAGFEENPRKKILKSGLKPVSCSSGVVHSKPFKVGQTYKDKKEIKTIVDLHSVQTRRELNPNAHAWLEKVPPKHWTRSHFSGRAVSDLLLNNLCEVFNSKILEARDKPIITCLEWIREYLMVRLVTVDKEIGKCKGSLTPTAQEILEENKKAVSQLKCVFNGTDKYQVTGQWMDQYVVNLQQRTCSCRQWDVTGIPCKHSIAAMYDKMENGEECGEPEDWVHKCYWLSTWKAMYSYKIEPINGKDMWPQSSCPIPIIPPKHHKQVGRPKKKRTKAADEPSSQGKHLSRKHLTVTCSKCHKKGHNSRSCKGQSDGDEVARARKKKKG